MLEPTTASVLNTPDTKMEFQPQRRHWLELALDSRGKLAAKAVEPLLDPGGRLGMLPRPLSCASGNSLGLQLYLEIQPLSVLHVLHVHPFLSIRSCVTPEVAPRLLKPTA